MRARAFIALDKRLLLDLLFDVGWVLLFKDCLCGWEFQAGVVWENARSRSFPIW